MHVVHLPAWGCHIVACHQQGWTAAMGLVRCIGRLPLPCICLMNDDAAEPFTTLTCCSAGVGEIPTCICCHMRVLLLVQTVPAAPYVVSRLCLLSHAAMLFGRSRRAGAVCARQQSSATLFALQLHRSCRRYL